MKRIYYLIFAVMMIQSCTASKTLTVDAVALDATTQFDEQMEQVIELNSAILDSALSSEKSFDPEPGTKTPVNLQEELVRIFDPANNRCNCGAKFEKKLRKLKLKNHEVSGFIPDIVQNNVEEVKAYVLNQSGAKILAHTFTYINANGEESKIIYARNSPTRTSFSETDNMMNGDGEFNMFLYSLDCSGYISAAVSAAGGIGGSAIETASKLANNVNNSMIVVGGVMNSPLYQAYKGEGAFAASDKETITHRINVLNAVLNEIPAQDRIDANLIKLDSNYKVVLASNTGESGFNGEGKVSTTGSIGVGVANFSGNGETGGTISRKSTFKNYNTYITGKNIVTIPEKVTVLSIKDLISSLTATLASL